MRAQHARPGLLDDQVAFFARRHRLAVLVDHVGVDAEERPGGRAGLERRDRQRGDHEAAGLGLPPGVHDRAALFADDVVIPPPGLRVDRLAHRAQQAQAAQVVAVGPGLAEAHQAADGGGRGVEDGDAVLLDHLPPAVGVGVVRRAFVHEAGRAVQQRRIDDVAVPGDPARVGGAPPAVFVLDVEDILQGGVGVDHVAAVGVHDALGPAGGAGGVQDEERVFGVHRLGVAHPWLAMGRLIRSWYQ